MGTYDHRHVTPAAIELIKRYKPFQATPYLAPEKIWEVGHGHSRTVRSGMNITKEQAHVLLMDDLNLCERPVLRLVTVPLNDAQFDALVVFVMGIYVSNFEQSTMLRLLNRGWYDQVPTQIMRWNAANSTLFPHFNHRRLEEARLWNSQADSRVAA